MIGSTNVLAFASCLWVHASHVTCSSPFKNSFDGIINFNNITRLVLKKKKSLDLLKPKHKNYKID